MQVYHGDSSRMLETVWLLCLVKVFDFANLDNEIWPPCFTANPRVWQNLYVYMFFGFFLPFVLALLLWWLAF